MSDDEELLESSIVANHGRTSRTDHMVAGVNSVSIRFKQVHSIKHTLGWNDSRIQVSKWYIEALKDIDGLVLPTVVEGRRHVFHLFVVQTQKRDELMAALKAEKIGCGLHYPTPIHLHPAYSGLEYPAGSFPHSERVASHGLSLPMFPGMTQEQVKRVAQVIAAHMKEQS